MVTVSVQLNLFWPIVLEAEACAPAEEAVQSRLEKGEAGQEQQLTAPQRQQGHQVLNTRTGGSVGT
jgi:hypothetical protein